MVGRAMWDADPPGQQHVERRGDSRVKCEVHERVFRLTSVPDPTSPLVTGKVHADRQNGNLSQF